MSIKDLPASACPVLGLQVCAAMPGFPCGCWETLTQVFMLVWPALYCMSHLLSLPPPHLLALSEQTVVNSSGDAVLWMHT